MRDKGYVTWITLADIFAIISMLLLVVGVFMAPPIFGTSLYSAVIIFVIAVGISACAPLLLIAHYNLWGNFWKYREIEGRTTAEERWVLCVLLVLAVGLSLGWVANRWLGS